MKNSLRGKTYEEIYGLEKALELRRKRSEWASKNIFSGYKLSNPNSLKGRTYSDIYGEEAAKIIKQARKDWAFKNPVPKEFHKKIGLSQRGVPKPKVSEKLKGRKLSESHRLRIVDAIRIREANPEYKKNKSLKMIKHWKDKDYVSKVLYGLAHQKKHRPTSYEKIIIDLCLEKNIPFRYIGDGKLWITSEYKNMNPDFIHESLKLIIEVYRDYWKDKDYEYNRRRLLEAVGYKVIFLSDKDILKVDVKNHCFGIISEFIYENKIA